MDPELLNPSDSPKQLDDEDLKPQAVNFAKAMESDAQTSDDETTNPDVTN